MDLEQSRLADPAWRTWGPYLSDRQWGTVREDYSKNGDAWKYITHEMARSKAYRWGEEGIAGISDDKQLLCFAPAFWNGNDPIIKERYFGVTGTEGNHGEDVKELYYYLDALPSHAYMKALYKYPIQAYPYEQLISENKKRGKKDPEYELVDTGIFNNDAYFDIYSEYAKEGPEDILIKFTIHNRWDKEATIHLLPTLWFRNTWVWGYDNYTPFMLSSNDGEILISHKDLPHLKLYAEKQAPVLFCDNETNNQKLYNSKNSNLFLKDGINNNLVHNDDTCINHNNKGTKAAFHYMENIPAKQNITIRLRLSKDDLIHPFCNFEEIFDKRKKETDDFYISLQQKLISEDEKRVQRQALAGMIWSKQFFYYDVQQWLDGDPAMPPPPPERKKGRNNDWRHLNNADVISMPDKWEYPWYAAWDLAFHCIPFALIDPAFAKKQLILLTKEWYMHPNGKLPAYEWSFSDVNPPVHAWATWKVYSTDKIKTGKGDFQFLEEMFLKLIINFTWWVNRKDIDGNNIFQGGFLGLDNIGVFDRSAPLPTGGYLEQADGTSWMAMYCLNLMRISLELALTNPVYQSMATKFFEHFLYIADSMNNMGENSGGLWDNTDEFFYDVLKTPKNETVRMKIRSMVGLIPLFAVEVIDNSILKALPEFAIRMQWFLDHRPNLASLVSRWNEKNENGKHLLSLLRGHKIKMILKRMLDENEFLSPYGIRALSKVHEKHPFCLTVQGETYEVAYVPAESDSNLFGGNSNWRGPIWMPVNYMLVESLLRFHDYYSDDFVVEFPVGSGQKISLKEVAMAISQRLAKLFLTNEKGERAVFGENQKLQQDPHFKDHILFYEYFHADTGRGVGASHQTGWTGLIAKLLHIY